MTVGFRVLRARGPLRLVHAVHRRLVVRALGLFRFARVAGVARSVPVLGLMRSVRSLGVVRPAV
jgi:hypothetical protein